MLLGGEISQRGDGLHAVRIPGCDAALPTERLNGQAGIKFDRTIAKKKKIRYSIFSLALRHVEG